MSSRSGSVARVAGLSMCVAMAAGVTSAGVITQSFTVPWQSGSHAADLSVNPFDPPSDAGPLTSVTISLEGYSYSRLTTGAAFDGSVPIRMTQSYDAIVEFGDDLDIASALSTGTVQEFNISSASTWFTTPTLMGAILVAPTIYLPGDGVIERFTSGTPISMHLTLDGGTDLLMPTPDHIGIVTGTEWVVHVSYAFVPAPGGLVLGGAAAMILAARRRR